MSDQVRAVDHAASANGDSKPRLNPINTSVGMTSDLRAAVGSMLAQDASKGAAVHVRYHN